MMNVHPSSPQAQFLRQYRLVILGATNVGKSALATQFIEGRFVERHKQTVENWYQTECDIDGEVASLEIFDTAGVEEYAGMRKQYMRTGEGFLLIYSITSRDSFEKISTFLEQILDVKGIHPFPVIIVANKCDLDELQTIGMNEGRALAKHRSCRFIETSAKDRTTVIKAFTSLVREIRNYNRRQQMGRPVMGERAPGIRSRKRDDDNDHGAGCGGCVII